MMSMMPYYANRTLKTRNSNPVRYASPFGEEFFRSFFGDNAVPAMKVDVEDKGSEYLLEADMPGMKKDDLKVEVHDGVLTISANYDESNDAKDDNDKYVYRERRCGSMRRSFNVEGIKEGEITAEFKDGVLSLNLPKTEPAPKPEARTITIE